MVWTARMSALTLVVLVIASDGGGREREREEAATAALRHAVEQTLGADTAITVRSVPRAPTDDEAIALETKLHADAVAEVAWNGAQPPAAHVHLHVASTLRWVDRDIGFSASDAAGEQGRTLGFAVASMLPERAQVTQPAASGSQPPPSTGAAPGAEPGRVLTPPREWVGSISATAVGHGSITGTGGGIGGAMAAEWYLGPHFALRAGIHARYADVEVAQSTALIVTAGAGLAWHAWPQSASRRFGIGARIDALAMLQSLTHLDDDDTSPVHQSRWLPAADAAAEASWLFTESASLVGAVGGEVAFGRTDVFTRRVDVTSLDPLHLFVELGIRARF